MEEKKMLMTFNNEKILKKADKLETDVVDIEGKGNLGKGFLR